MSQGNTTRGAMYNVFRRCFSVNFDTIFGCVGICDIASGAGGFCSATLTLLVGLSQGAVVTPSVHVGLLIDL